MTVIDSVQDVIEKSGHNIGSQFYCEYQEAVAMYQELLNKGLASKRSSQLLPVSDMSVVAPVYFNCRR